MRVSQSRWIRGVALAVTFIFALETILPAQNGLAASPGFYSGVSVPVNETSVRVSPGIGKIERVFSSARRVPVTFYYIQDAHASEGAQGNITKILESLLEQKKLDMLFIEGAAGSLSSATLKPFSEDAQNKEFRDALFHKGLINGASQFLGEHPGVPAYGIEETGLYRKNLEAYRAVMQYRHESQRFLDHVEVSLNRDIKKIIDPQTYHFLKMWRLQQGARSDFNGYMKYLFECSSKHLGIDWKDFLTQKDWPQLVRLFRILNTEKIPEHGALSKEIEQLKRVLGPEGGIEIDWIENAATDLSWKSRELQTGSTTPRVIAEHVMEKFLARGLSWGRYPEVRKLLAMKVFQSEIEAGRLLGEIEALEGRVYESLRHGNPEAGRWLAFYQDYYLLKQALSLELRREQVGRFRAHFKNNWMEAYKRFLRERTLPHEDVVAPLAGLVLEFYARAEAREDSFFEAIKQKIQEPGFLKGNESRHIVVVAGGYHKEGLLRRTEAFGIPFNLVTPYFNPDGKVLPYSEFLMGRYTGSSTITSAQVPVMVRPEARAMIGGAALNNYAAAFIRIKREVGSRNGEIVADRGAQAMRPGSAAQGLKTRAETRENQEKKRFSTDYGEARGDEPTWAEQAVVIGVMFLSIGSLIGALLAAKLPAEMGKIRQQQVGQGISLSSAETQKLGQVSVNTRSEARNLPSVSTQKRRGSFPMRGTLPASTPLKPANVVSRSERQAATLAAPDSEAAVVIGNHVTIAREVREAQLRERLAGVLNDPDVSEKTKGEIQAFLAGKASPKVNAATLIQRVSIDRGNAKKTRGAVTVPVVPTPQVRRMRSEGRGVRTYVLRMFFFAVAMAGLLSGCATSLPSREKVREKIAEDRRFILPEKEISRPSAGLVVVTEESLAQAMITNDPEIQKYRFKVSIRDARKKELAGSVSLMPTVGFADGKPVLGLGVEGNMPNLGKVSLTGVSLQDASTALLALTAELSKYWKGQDILARELAQQMVETAGLELQHMKGNRYLALLRSAYDMKTAEGQYSISKMLLAEIDRAIAASRINTAATEPQRQVLLRLRSDWLVESAKFRASAEQAEIPLRTVYGQDVFDSGALSNSLGYVQFPAGWKVTPEQARAIAFKATSKNGDGSPASPELALAYAARLTAATAAELARRENGFSLGLTGFNYFDRLSTTDKNVSTLFNTKVVPAADQRTDDKQAIGLQGGMTFGPAVRAQREVSLLEIKVSEADIAARRDDVDARIAYLLRTIEAEHTALEIGAQENREIYDYLARAKHAGVSEDKIMASDLKLRVNQIKALSSHRAITLATKELQIFTRDKKGLPQPLSGRSESRFGKLAGFPTSIGMVLVENRFYPLKAAKLLCWGLVKFVWDAMRREGAPRYAREVFAGARLAMLRMQGPLTEWSESEHHPEVRSTLWTCERVIERVIRKLENEDASGALKLLRQVHDEIPSGTYQRELVGGIEAVQQMFLSSSPKVRAEVRSEFQFLSRKKTGFGGWNLFFGMLALFFSLSTGAFAGSPREESELSEKERQRTVFSPGDMAEGAQSAESIIKKPAGGPEREESMEVYDQFVKDTANAISDKSASDAFRDLAAVLKKSIRNEVDRERVQTNLDAIGRTLAGVDVPAEFTDMSPLLQDLVTKNETVPMPTDATIDLDGILRNTKPPFPGIEPVLSSTSAVATGSMLRGTDSPAMEAGASKKASNDPVHNSELGDPLAATAIAGAVSLGAELAPAVQQPVSPDNSVMEILGGVEVADSDILKDLVPEKAAIALAPAAENSLSNANILEESLSSASVAEAISTAVVVAASAQLPPALDVQALPDQDEDKVKSKPKEEYSDLSPATVLYEAGGQATLNPFGAFTLNFPSPVDTTTYFVKSGDVVKEGAVLVRGEDTKRENRIRFLEGRTQELKGLIAAGKKDPGSLDPDTMRSYQFDMTEFLKELVQLQAEQRACILVSPRPATVWTVGQGSVAQGGAAVQLDPLDLGVFRIPVPSYYSGADDLEFFVKGQKVTVLDWEASQFDLAKGENGEFILTIRCAFPAVGPFPAHGEQCAYKLRLLKNSDPKSVLAGSSHGKAGLHTTVPSSQFVSGSIPSIPGLEAGVFHAVVRDGQDVKAGNPEGEWVPVDHGEQARLAETLGSLAQRARKANQEFATVPESVLQDYDARAARARASVPTNRAPILISAPASGRVQGINALDGQMLAPGQLKDAGVIQGERFLGASVDPRSAAWTGELSNDDPYLIPVTPGTVKAGDLVSVTTSAGVLAGTVYAVIPLGNSFEWLLADKEGVVIRVNDEPGILREGRAVDLDFDGGRKASKWAKSSEIGPLTRRTPPLRMKDPLPAAVQEEFQMHPGKKVGLFGLVKIARDEKNPTQRWMILEYINNVVIARYLGWHIAGFVALALALWNLPKLLFFAGRGIGHRRFFRQDPAVSLEKLHDEVWKIGMRLKRNANKQRAARGDDDAMRVYNEIVAPLQIWIDILSEKEVLTPDERNEISTKASELAQHPRLRFSGEHFEDLSRWKSKTYSLVKLRGILARVSILTSQAADSQLRENSGEEDETERHELLRFQGKMADFAENFNESYNLAHRLIALSSVIDLYPPKLRIESGMSFSDWRKVAKNRFVIWTFPIFRLALLVSPMALYNRHVTLDCFHNVAVNMEKLGISGFTSVEEAMSVAKKGLHKAFHPVADVDELEGNVLAAYYGRWLGRALVVTGLIALFSLPLLLLLFNLSHQVVIGVKISGVVVASFSIWRHIGPMFKELTGDGYHVFNHEIRNLRRAAQKTERKLPPLARPVAARKNTGGPSKDIDASGEALMMTKMRSALLNQDLRDSVEVIVLLPPEHGENQGFFEAMASSDSELQGFHFKVAESDGLFPGNIGQFFAARDLAEFIGKKEQIYWFPQPGIPFAVAMSVFKMNLAEALRMVSDFRGKGMKYGEFLFPGGDLSTNAISYTKNGSQVVIDARLASLEEVEQGRYPVILGRNGSPRHEVEHIVRRPEELAGALSQYGHIFGTGLTLDNRVTRQFAIPKGPKALVFTTETDYLRMQELISEYRTRTEELIGRYGPFWVDFDEDFAGVIAEFRRQILENDSTVPNLQQLARSLKTFPDGEGTANPYAKMYALIGRKLFGLYRDSGKNEPGKDVPRVEAFVPAASDHLFVSGNDRPKIARYLERVKKAFPELVNDAAFTELGKPVGPDPDEEVSLFRDKDNQILKLPRKVGLARNLTALKAASFLTQGGNMFFQQRSNLASSNQGLLDLPVFEHLEPGENAAQALRRGILEELRDGRPLPPSLSSLPVLSLSTFSYEVLHERRRQAPTTRKEEASVFHLSLDENFDVRELIPGEDGVKIVSYSLEDVLTMHSEKHGIFTPRTFAVLSQFLPEIEKEMTAENGSVPRAEMRSARRAVVVQALHAYAEPFAADQFLLPEQKAVSFAPEAVRLATAIRITELLLREDDRALLPRLRALLTDLQTIVSRSSVDLSTLLELPLSTLVAYSRQLDTAGSLARPADSAQTLFLDARIVENDEQLLLLSGLPFRVVVLFSKGQEARMSAFEKKALPGQFEAVLADDSVSAAICSRLKLEVSRSQFRKEDYAFVGMESKDVKKVSAYVANLVYCGKERHSFDSEVLLSALWYLLRSPEVFRLGSVRKGPWEIKAALIHTLERFAESVRATAIAA